jgi:hypothetical protein
MRSASSSNLTPGLLACRVGLALVLVCASAALVALAAAGSSRPVIGVPKGEAYLARATTVLGPTGVRRIHTASWWGRTYTASTGELVNISISESYPVDDAVGQTWANFFAGLVHGSELQLLKVFVVTPDEVGFVCGNVDALGCYGSNELVIIGEPAFGTDPKEVASHEYGHHVAFNRVNAPWVAIDWGTKRWTSYEGICRRVAAGTAFPGDESVHYRQNPGEAFAETFRALNDSKAGLNLPWSIVDASFIPNAGALKAVEDDVLHPWTTPTSKVVHAGFASNGRKAWKLILATPLDGQLEVTLSLPKGGFYNLTLLAPEGKTVLGRGLWSGTSAKTLSYTICGERSLVLKVARVGLAGRFTLRYSRP